MAELVRTTGPGYTMVHRADCHMAKRGHAVPWDWADDVHFDQLRVTIRHYGYRTCRYCVPIPGGPRTSRSRQ